MHYIKTIRIKLEVPLRYKWIACQPWGTIMAFTKKPKIVKDGDASYWDMQDAEQELSGIMEREPNYKGRSNWQKTLRKI